MTTMVGAADWFRTCDPALIAAAHNLDFCVSFRIALLTTTNTILARGTYIAHYIGQRHHVCGAPITGSSGSETHRKHFRIDLT